MVAQVRGDQQLRDLSLRLREMGTEGKGLRRELYRAINDAAAPLTKQIVDPAWLYPYMPNRYARDDLAPDLAVTTVKRGGQRASVLIRARGRTRDRQVTRLNAGLIKHPVFARKGTPRRDWHWVVQTKGMRSGFFTDAVRSQAPDIREKVLAAVHDVGKKITS
jgi:hypothetical protein